MEFTTDLTHHQLQQQWAPETFQQPDPPGLQEWHEATPTASAPRRTLTRRRSLTMLSHNDPRAQIARNVAHRHLQQQQQQTQPFQPPPQQQQQPFQRTLQRQSSIGPTDSAEHKDNKTRHRRRNSCDWNGKMPTFAHSESFTGSTGGAFLWNGSSAQFVPSSSLSSPQDSPPQTTNGLPIHRGSIHEEDEYSATVRQVRQEMEKHQCPMAKALVWLGHCTPDVRAGSEKETALVDMVVPIHLATQTDTSPFCRSHQKMACTQLEASLTSAVGIVRHKEVVTNWILYQCHLLLMQCRLMAYAPEQYDHQSRLRSLYQALVFFASLPKDLSTGGTSPLTSVSLRKSISLMILAAIPVMIKQSYHGVFTQWQTTKETDVPSLLGFLAPFFEPLGGNAFLRSPGTIKEMPEFFSWSRPTVSQSVQAEALSKRTDPLCAAVADKTLPPPSRLLSLVRLVELSTSRTDALTPLVRSLQDLTIGEKHIDVLVEWTCQMGRVLHPNKATLTDDQCMEVGQAARDSSKCRNVEFQALVLTLLHLTDRWAKDIETRAQEAPPTPQDCSEAGVYFFGEQEQLTQAARSILRYMKAASRSTVPKAVWNEYQTLLGSLRRALNLIRTKQQAGLFKSIQKHWQGSILPPIQRNPDLALFEELAFFDLLHLSQATRCFSSKHIDATDIPTHLFRHLWSLSPKVRNHLLGLIVPLFVVPTETGHLTLKVATPMPIVGWTSPSTKQLWAALRENRENRAVFASQKDGLLNPLQTTRTEVGTNYLKLCSPS